MNHKSVGKCPFNDSDVSASLTLSDLELTEISSALLGGTNVEKHNRERYRQILFKRAVKAIRHVNPEPEYPKIAKVIDYHYGLYKCANDLPTPISTKHIERAIISRLCARGLENRFYDYFSDLLGEVKQLYVNATHEAGVICVIRPPNESVSGHKILLPLQFLGKTEFHNTFLKRISFLERRLFLTLPLIRRVLSFCVDLPKCLINLSEFRDQPYSISQLRRLFDGELEKAQHVVRFWYRELIDYIRVDDSYSPPKELEMAYYSCATGLLSIHLTATIRRTEEHVLEVTSNNKLFPMLDMKLEYLYKNNLYVLPGLHAVIDVFVGLVEKIYQLSLNLPAVETILVDNYKMKYVEVYLPESSRIYYEKQVAQNINNHYMLIFNYVDKLNEDLTEVYEEHAKWAKVAEVDLTVIQEYRESPYKSVEDYANIIGNVDLVPPLPRRRWESVEGTEEITESASLSSLESQTGAESKQQDETAKAQTSQQSPEPTSEAGELPDSATNEKTIDVPKLMQDTSPASESSSESSDDHLRSPLSSERSIKLADDPNEIPIDETLGDDSPTSTPRLSIVDQSLQEPQEIDKKPEVVLETMVAVDTFKESTPEVSELTIATTSDESLEPIEEVIKQLYTSKSKQSLVTLDESTITLASWKPDDVIEPFEFYASPTSKRSLKSLSSESLESTTVVETIECPVGTALTQPLEPIELIQTWPSKEDLQVTHVELPKELPKIFISQSWREYLETIEKLQKIREGEDNAVGHKEWARQEQEEEEDEFEEEEEDFDDDEGEDIPDSAEISNITHPKSESQISVKTKPKSKKDISRKPKKSVEISRVESDQSLEATEKNINTGSDQSLETTVSKTRTSEKETRKTNSETSLQPAEAIPTAETTKKKGSRKAIKSIVPVVTQETTEKATVEAAAPSQPLQAKTSVDVAEEAITMQLEHLLEIIEPPKTKASITTKSIDLSKSPFAIVSKTQALPKSEQSLPMPKETSKTPTTPKLEPIRETVASATSKPIESSQQTQDTRDTSPQSPDHFLGILKDALEATKPVKVEETVEKAPKAKSMPSLSELEKIEITGMILQDRSMPSLPPNYIEEAKSNIFKRKRMRRRKQTLSGTKLEPEGTESDISSDITFEEGYVLVDYYKSLIDRLSLVLDFEYFPIGTLSQSSAREELIRILFFLIEKISDNLVKQHKWLNEDICEQFEMLKLRATKTPETSEELIELGTYMLWASTELLTSLKERIEESLGVMFRLMEMTTLALDHIDLNARTVRWVDDIKDVIEYNSSMYEQCKFEFEERLQRAVEEIHAGIRAIEPYLKLLDDMDDSQQGMQYIRDLSEILIRMRDFERLQKFINREEVTFKFAVSQFPEIEELKQYMYPFIRVIIICRNFKRLSSAWLYGPFEFLDFSVAENAVEEMLKELMKSQKTFRKKLRQAEKENHPRKYEGAVDDPDVENQPAPVRLCTGAIQDIKNFRPSLKMMGIMCNDALLQRHWDDMSEIAGFDLTPNAGTTLAKFMSMGLEDDIDKYEIISSGAIKERQLLLNLRKMQAEWDDVFFKTSLYKDTGISILTQLDDIQVVLDDQIIKTLTMRGSVFVKPYKAEVKAWYEKVTRMNATIDEWGKVQAQWLYLLPIFSSKDIVSQMPNEGTLFKEVDGIYRRYMGVVDKEPKVIETAASVGLLENMENCTKLLEKINEGVTAYLESKRLYFPRFFFLSNDEMLEILSETKDPLRVQPHLRKCFEGINRLDFDDDLQIHAMFSEEGEQINFRTIIKTKEARGSVEKWLVQVETQMLMSVRNEIRYSYKNYQIKDRKKWVRKWPGQVVLAVSQIFWTANVHTALSSKVPGATNTFIEELKSDMQDIVALVRKPKLSNLTRITIKALIVIDVHAKDVVQELIDKGVKNDKEFKWLAQLRYYWEKECYVRIINATVKYAYEYLGNSDRLVITPLTDRCYRTLVGAYHLHLNGAPEGPAGTGKTETTKDLAKALAVQCVVFNCSDGLDYKAMGKFFKGLASAGAWACFDEFNRIEIEVLSVVAQQILCIVLAVRAHASTFMFEGTELTLNPACYVCITMNPGYAGRSELPDNLKVLFRTVAMMVPDYAMIGEISLYSYGFVDARKLSVKIVTVYRLCSEQLSSQNHYDYGMRAVKSVLSACGNNKRKFPNEVEDILLLRSILDVNLPKFLNHDVPLFEGIISDLFPGVVLPPADYRTLIAAMTRSCEKRLLQLKECVVTKVIQTYEMMIVRHGFMLVGEPFAGKTSTLKMLADSLTILNEQGEPQEKVQYQFINPKAVTMGQLYGQFDPVSYEWFDGVVATCFRRFATDPVPDRKWVIFDGPVDAVWIENMNTVLDDNKKLCLMSGEVMAMTNVMSMIFEVMDLTQASPATVSRCGMIYMEPATLGWKPHVDSWIETCTREWCDRNKEYVLALFDWIVPPSLYYIRKYCRQMCNSGQINLVKSMMQIIEMVLNKACDDSKEIEADAVHIPGWILAAFMHATVWGLGGILDTDSREKFEEYVIGMWTGTDEDNSYPSNLDKPEIAIPSEGKISDYIYIYKGKGNWKSWPETVRSMRVEDSANIQQALIPTVDTAKYMHMVEMHIHNNVSVLLVGPTGTGKSFYMQDLLMNQLDQEKYEPAFVTFTVKISANQTQNLIISKLNKRKRGHYGAPKGKLCVIFVDDLNMPVKEIYGAQPPIELLRQYFDHKNWYDLKDTSPVYLHDILLTAAMGPPGGSRQEIYARFLRHFSIFSINEFSDESMSKIYGNILLLALKKNGFPSDVITNVQQIVAATLDIYQQSMLNLRPTPAKSHYVFNLRDFSRIIFGCGMLKKESDNKYIFPKIWVHEVLRVFYDRLVDAKDKDWLFNQLKTSVKQFYREKFEMVFEDLEAEGQPITEESLQKLMFTAYLDLDATEEEQKYEEITNAKVFYDIAMSCLDEYNSTHKNKMDVVLFKYALEHLSKICRVLAMPCGSALLVGISGSGRQSLTKLSTMITGHTFFQPEITKNYGMNEWRDDLKKVVKEAGGRGKSSIFLFTEGQIKEEGFLQDIDCLLNSGEVPNIFQIDEKQEILELTRLAAQGGNRNIDISALAVFSYFIKRTREKLHIILCFSPIGSAFRTRLRLYPSLVNCCTIDWFEDWPEDALEKVAHSWMEDVNLSQDVKESAIKACKYFHVAARKVSADFYLETARRSYITSASYLGLIKSYTTLTNTRQEELMTAKRRYVVGLEKLQFAAEQIAEMQKDLEAFQPELKKMSDNAAEMTRIIERETKEVEKASAIVKRDEDVANEQAAEAQALKAECEADLAEAIPILEDAIAALNTLKPADITLVKSMKNPPDAVKLVMAAVCVIKDIKPDRIPDPSTGRRILDYWGPSKRILGDIAFLQSLKDFDKDHIKVEIMAKIRKEYLPHKDFKPNVVAKASSAAEGLCKWIIAMDKYDKVAKEVAPKKEKLDKAERAFAATMAILSAKKAEVAKLEEKLADLKVQLADATQKQQELQDRVTLCENKLIRANKLIGGLGGEKSRWIAAANGLQNQYDCLGGDILLSCAIIAYLSPFTIQWRLNATKDWLDYAQVLKIPVTPTYDFTDTLGSEIKIQNWQIFGLPGDAFSTQNAIIQDNSRRWSLLIDPQLQANLWIKKLEKENHIEVTKFSEDYMKILEKCVEAGTPALIENIAEDLEAPLDPLLLKATFRQAGMLVIALGDNVMGYNPNFRLYLTSKLRNPHYLPEVFNKVTIINFALTFDGLEDQLLGIVVAKERPDLQEKRQELIVQSARNKSALADVEEMILKTLSETKGDILENESAIKILDHSKLISTNIIQKQKVALQTQKEIDAFRMDYKPMATHSAGLYYCISDLPNLDPMYQYSLGWFINLYISAIDKAEQHQQLLRRLTALKDSFTYILYSNVCRSLFEKDKLMFSFLLCIKILLQQKLVAEQEFGFLLTGGLDVENPIPNPSPDWLSNKSWNEICRLDQLPAFHGFQPSFVQNISRWKALYDESEPQKCPLPSPWNTNLSLFQQLLVMRTLRLDKITVSISLFVEKEMGTKFIIPPPFDIAMSFNESNAFCPLIFILSAGTDPMGALTSFAEARGTLDNFNYISLGQGQGPIAQALILQAQDEGTWVCLQNCHLAVSWMPTLERICDSFDVGNTHINFRLWLTSYPSEKFPISILQNGVKMTNEPPSGLQQNLLRSYLNEPLSNITFFTGCLGREVMFCRLLYGIAFFHAVVQERRSFGPLGWNIPYGFNESDFDISVQQLKMFINEYEDDPYEGICYLTGECNYGGRVTDDWDRRLIVTILQDFLNPQMVSNMAYTFTKVGKCYDIPKSAEYEEYVKHINNLPQVHPPEVFGLHQNAGITRDLQVSNLLLNSIILVQGEGSASSGDDSLLDMVASDILAKLPPNFDLEVARNKFPVLYSESMNTVLVQEMERFTKLLNEIRTSLQTIQKAIKGLVVMTPALEVLSNSLLLGRIPAAWDKVSYPSLKTLPNYIGDFIDRIMFLNNWFLHGKPNTFWLSGFFFTQAFLTGAKQNYARKYTIPIDQLTFDFEVLKTRTSDKAAEDGIYVYGLFTDGARWDIDKGVLRELFPKILYDTMPLIWLVPITNAEYHPRDRYLAPLYKTSERRGTLSTTGHSTNYVLPFLLETDLPTSHWIKRSVALLCQLS